MVHDLELLKKSMKITVVRNSINIKTQANAIVTTLCDCPSFFLTTAHLKQFRRT